MKGPPDTFMSRVQRATVDVTHSCSVTLDVEDVSESRSVHKPSPLCGRRCGVWVYLSLGFRFKLLFSVPSMVNVD